MRAGSQKAGSQKHVSRDARGLPVLTLDGAELAVARGADAAALHAVLADWDVVRMLTRIAWPVDPATVRDFATAAEGAARTGEAYAFSIRPAGATAAGVISLERAASGRVGLGYWLGRAYWGRGLMSDAVRAVSAFAFAEMGVEAIDSGVFFDNPASLRVQEKAGFRRVGEREVYSLARGVAVRHIDTRRTARGLEGAGR